MADVFHVNPSGLGGWRVERVGSGEPESFKTREEACARAKQLAAEAGDDASIIVHDADGRIDAEAVPSA